MLLDGWKNQSHTERMASDMKKSEAIKGLIFLKEKLYNGIFKDRIRCIDEAIKALEEAHEYRKLGNVEEVRKAVEKMKPKKPDLEGDGYADGEIVLDTWICPNCGVKYEIDYEQYDFCPDCGQKLDWSEVE